MRLTVLYSSLFVLLLLVFFLQLNTGAVAIVWKDVLQSESIANVIIFQHRLPAALGAALAGASFALAGLVLQRYFKNPIADASVLGISSGVNLGIILLALLTALQIDLPIVFTDYLFVIFGMLGALSVVGVLLFFAKKVAGRNTILIVGILISGWIMAFSQIIQSTLPATAFKTLFFWASGNFKNLTYQQLLLMTVVSLSSFFYLFSKHSIFDKWLLGDVNAQLMGINLQRFRMGLLFIVSIMVAVTTVFCGPVAFVGLAVPHIAARLLHSSLHYHLLIVSVLLGALISGISNLIASVDFHGIFIPVNAINSFIGVPFVIFLLVKNKQYDSVS